MVLGELFSPNQASAVYSRALDEIEKNEKARSLLGEPIRGYRENDRRSHWK